MKKKATLAKDEKGKQIIRIEFSYDVEIIHQVRTLAGRKYHAEQKCWSAPLYVRTLSTLLDWGFELDDRLQAYIDESKARANIKIPEISGLQGTLYPFQQLGVAFIERNKGRALIADEMGLGKTIQALAWLQLHLELRPVIIVTPASLKLNWERETFKWIGNVKMAVLSGTTPYILQKDLEIIIINYDILQYWVSELLRLNPQILITDECHYYKSNRAQRTRAVKLLAKRMSHIIALSGTPIINRPIEAFNALKIIDPYLFPDYWYFVNRYCNAKHTGFGLDVNGASNTRELHQILTSSIMIRRLKRDVLTELPPKTYSFIPIELSNSDEYAKAERDYIAFVLEQKGLEAARRASNAVAFAKTEGLKQLAVKGKLNGVIKWVQEFLEVEQKLVVFATHRFVIEKLYNKFGEIAARLEGGMTENQKQQAVDTFQKDSKKRLFIGNIQAAGTGITLTASSNVAFIELPWSPGVLVQAEDRCHRIGQRDNVTVHYLLAKGTIEEKIVNILDKKRIILDSILDGMETQQGSLLKEIMEMYEKQNDDEK